MKVSPKYQLLKDDFDFAVRQLRERREEIEKLRTENIMLRHENLRVTKENEELIKQSYISNAVDDVKYAEEFAGVSTEADKIQEN
ncbi:hypothetical protein Q8G37_15840 [Bacillus wiedmannii]|uniref:hypothetical protein n=1 Tax=Bacillus wiedmannii TaxID=1890302 RepID=UPI00272FDF11|nr:hypothetical protein [Bacillus wiedmannii]MDP1457918.1 hypothetical protein [Bacillus wiedmannii]